MKDETLCVSGVVAPTDGFSSLSTPVYRASTIAFPTVEAYRRRREAIYDGYSYGLYGTPTSRALESRLAELDGGARSLVLPSGFAAIALSSLALSGQGRTVLFPDCAYDTVRPFADCFLQRFGVRSVFYDPMLAGGIAALLTSDVALLWVESPGSVTMEVQDLPAIVAAARAVGVPVAVDNAWATPLRFRPLKMGADLSVVPLSKYLNGHSDVVLGAVTVADPALYRTLKDCARHLGYGVSADDCSLVLRGLETLAVRLDRAEATAERLMAWAATRACVAEVRHPSRPGSPGHAHWQRDFSGGTGLFSLFIKPEFRDNLAAGIEALRLFTIGASWGGTGSIVAVIDPAPPRTAGPVPHDGPIVRISTGLEHADDLIADLTQAFDRIEHSETNQHARS